MNKPSCGRLLDWFCRPDIDVVAIDADDTIWHDSRYFLRLKEALFDLGRASGIEDTSIIGALEANEMGIQHGEAAYANAILKTASDIGLNENTRLRLNRDVQKFLAHPIELLPYVRESLTLLRSYRCLLITRGQRREQERKLIRSGLVEYFAKVVVFAKKNSAEMKKVFESAETRSEKVIVIGNSVRHDIIPATQNNALAIWLNHPENVFGRNSVLPTDACEVDGWEPIYMALTAAKA